MALKDIWIPKKNTTDGSDGDYIMADDINEIAEAVIDLEKGNENKEFYTKDETYSKGETDVLIQDAILNSEMNIWDTFYPRYMIDDKIGYIEDQIGDIDAALDELHGYATSLMGGEA